MCGEREGGLRWGRSRQVTLERREGGGLGMRFHKILPEAKSSSRCTNVVVWIHKVWGEEKCAKVPFSHWGETGECYFNKDPSAQFRAWIRRLNFHTFHIPKRTFAVSLHLSFLAILLHFLLQLLLLFGRAVLLFARLPATLPVQKEMIVTFFLTRYSWKIKHESHESSTRTGSLAKWKVRKTIVGHYSKQQTNSSKKKKG